MAPFIAQLNRRSSTDASSNNSRDTKMLTIKIVVLVVGSVLVFTVVFWAALVISRRQKRMTALRKRILHQRMQLSVDSDMNNGSTMKYKVSSPANRRASRGTPVGPRIPIATPNTPPEGTNVPRKPPRLSLGSNVRKSRHEKILQLSPSLRAIAVRAGSSSASNLQAPPPSLRQHSKSSSSSSSSPSSRTGSTSSGSRTLQNSTAPSSTNHSKNSSFSSTNKPSFPSSASPVILASVELSRLDTTSSAVQNALAKKPTPPLADSPTFVSRSNTMKTNRTTKTKNGRAQSSGSIIIALDHPPPSPSTCAPVLEMPHPVSWNPSVFGKYTIDGDKHMSGTSTPNFKYDGNNPLSVSRAARSSRGSVLTPSYRNSAMKSPRPTRARSVDSRTSTRFSGGSWQTSMTQTDTYSFLDSEYPNARKPSAFDYQHLSIQPFDVDDIGIQFDDSSDVEKLSTFRNSGLLQPKPNPKNTMTSIASLLRMYSTSGKNSRATTRPPSTMSQKTEGTDTPSLPGEISSYRQTIHKVQRSQRDSLSTRTDSPTVQQEFILPLFAKKPRVQSSHSLHNTASYRK